MISVLRLISLIGEFSTLRRLFGETHIRYRRLILLHRDLARFIAAGRIPCTIDRVNGKGVIETNRPDDKNKQYQDVVRQGDQLITKLQKYGQAVRLRGSERA